MISRGGHRAIVSALEGNKDTTMRHLGGIKLSKYRKLFRSLPKNHLTRSDNNFTFLTKVRHSNGYFTELVCAMSGGTVPRDGRND